MHFAQNRNAFRLDETVCVMHSARMPNEIHLPTIRADLGITQAELALRAGVNITTVWRWENEGIPSKGPARAFLERLADDAARSRAGAA